LVKIIHWYRSAVLTQDTIGASETQGYGTVFSRINSAKALAETTLQAQGGGELPK
jgi:hypothetical protein